VEEDEAANPLNVGFFCPIGVVFEANGIADLVKELSGWVLHDVLPEVADSANHSIMGGSTESFSFVSGGYTESFGLSNRFGWIYGKILPINCWHALTIG
jgi:hypothetical protein